VFPADFGYTRAGSVSHALAVLDSARAAGEDVKVLAGGQSLLPMMKLRLATPAALLDIGDLAELKGITTDGHELRIGALSTYRDLQRDPRIRAGFPAIADALAVLADPQVRARGTIGGAVAHADPAADLTAVLLALGARVLIASSARARSVLLAKFLLGVFSTDLAPDELITAVTIPVAPPGQAYEKFPQPASHLPLAGACAVIEAKHEGLASARVAITGIAPRAFHADQVERMVAHCSTPISLADLADYPIVGMSGSPHDLRGRTGPAGPDAPPAGARLVRWSMDAVLTDLIAGSLSATGTEPLADQHASGPFRVHLAAVMTRRALTRALARALGQPGSASGDWPAAGGGDD
jgi:carbon-monoxide dehydrogenase medium subunit